VSFTAITLCVATHWVFIVVSVYFVIDSVRKFWIHPGRWSIRSLHTTLRPNLHSSNTDSIPKQMTIWIQKHLVEFNVFCDIWGFHWDEDSSHGHLACDLATFRLYMETIRLSEMLLSYHDTICRHNPKDRDLKHFLSCIQPNIRGGVTHACRKRRLKWEATLLLGDINTEACSSGMGVGRGANNPTL
jgi:hypothetical protein